MSSQWMKQFDFWIYPADSLESKFYPSFTHQASTTNSDGMLTLDLIQEEDVPSTQGQDSREDTLDKAASQRTPDTQRSITDTSKLSTCNETPGKSQSLPRKSESAFNWSENHRTPQLRKKTATSDKNRCASMDEILTHCEARALPHCSTSAPVQPISQLQDLITQKLERTQELLTEVRVQGKGKGSPAGKSSSPEVQRMEAERLLEEAVSTWGQARDVLEEVKELRAFYKQLDSVSSVTLSPIQNGKLNSPQQANSRKSMMWEHKSPPWRHFSTDSSCWLLYYHWNSTKKWITWAISVCMNC